MRKLRKQNFENNHFIKSKTSKSQPFDTSAALSTSLSIGTTQQTTRKHRKKSPPQVQNVQVSAVQHSHNTQHVKEHWKNAKNDERTMRKHRKKSPLQFQNVQVSAVRHRRRTQHLKEHWNNATNDEKTSEKITATSPKRPSHSRSSPPTYSAALTALEQRISRCENFENKTSKTITSLSPKRPSLNRSTPPPHSARH